jgi:hypothetical protein
MTLLKSICLQVDHFLSVFQVRIRCFVKKNRYNFLLLKLFVDLTMIDVIMYSNHIGPYMGVICLSSVVPSFCIVSSYSILTTKIINMTYSRSCLESSHLRSVLHFSCLDISSTFVQVGYTLFPHLSLYV